MNTTNAGFPLAFASSAIVRTASRIERAGTARDQQEAGRTTCLPCHDIGSRGRVDDGECHSRALQSREFVRSRA